MAKKKKSPKKKKSRKNKKSNIEDIGIGNYTDGTGNKLGTKESKDRHQRIQRFVILWFYGSYGLFYVLAFVLRIYLPVVEIPFVIAELNQEVKLQMALAELMDLVLLGVLFSMNAFMAFEKNYASSSNRKNRSKYYTSSCRRFNMGSRKPCMQRKHRDFNSKSDCACKKNPYLKCK